MNDDELDRLIKRKAEELEGSYPVDFLEPDKLWHALSEKRHRHIFLRRTVWISAAATIVAAILFYGLLRHAGEVGEREINQTAVTDSMSVKEKHAMDFITRYCAGNNIACNTPELHNLRRDLTQSYDALEEIEKQLQLYGQDRALVRAKERVESHQARLIKTIVKTL